MTKDDAVRTSVDATVSSALFENAVHLAHFGYSALRPAILFDDMFDFCTERVRDTRIGGNVIENVGEYLAYWILCLS